MHQRVINKEKSFNAKGLFALQKRHACRCIDLGTRAEKNYQNVTNCFEIRFIFASRRNAKNSRFVRIIFSICRLCALLKTQSNRRKTSEKIRFNQISSTFSTLKCTHKTSPIRINKQLRKIDRQGLFR